MKSYSYEKKYEIVLEYLDGKMGYPRLAKKHGVKSITPIRIWVGQYKRFGIEGLKPNKVKQTFTREFKLSVLRYRELNKLSYEETADHFGILSYTTIWKWQKKFEVEKDKNEATIEKRSPPVMKKNKKTNEIHLKENERQELIRLREENENLKAGIEYQKKLQALTQHIEEKRKKR
nr:helix-turn-helix domain-containing protein [Mammaliicoccus sp. Marseille-Q6498]